MASFGYEARETTAYVKGGMPLHVEGTYNWDESGADVTDITLYWVNTGKPVTPRFEASLSRADWDSIAEAIANA